MKPRSQSTSAKAEGALYRAVLTLSTPKECRDFFSDLCTPAELQALADRWVVVEQLQRGLSYRQIRARTGVSLTTIARVARYVERGAGGYSTVVNRLQEARRG